MSDFVPLLCDAGSPTVEGFRASAIWQLMVSAFGPLLGFVGAYGLYWLEYRHLKKKAARERVGRRADYLAALEKDILISAEAAELLLKRLREDLLFTPFMRLDAGFVDSTHFVKHDILAGEILFAREIDRLRAALNTANEVLLLRMNQCNSAPYPGSDELARKTAGALERVLGIFVSGCRYVLRLAKQRRLGGPPTIESDVGPDADSQRPQELLHVDMRVSGGTPRDKGPQGPQIPQSSDAATQTPPPTSAPET